MRGSRKFCHRGPNLITFMYYFSWWGDRGSKYRYKWTIIGPPAKRHLNGVSLADRWLPNIKCWLGSFVIIQGIRTSIARKPYIFCDFSRETGPHAPPPLWTRLCAGTDHALEKLLKGGPYSPLWNTLMTKKEKNKKEKCCQDPLDGYFLDRRMLYNKYDYLMCWR